LPHLTRQHTRLSTREEHDPSQFPTMPLESCEEVEMKVDIKPFIGEHCESTTAGTLLGQLGIELSEPLLFGLGQGIGFVIWNMKGMDFPFMGGRIKPDLLTRNIAGNLDLTLTSKETSSQRKAWREVKYLLDNGKTVGLKLDCFHLEYFTNPIHFAGHYVTIVGYDDKNAYLVDTAQQGSYAATSLESLALARNERGPMSSRNLYFTLEKKAAITPLADAILSAIRSNAITYLNPPIKNMGHEGIRKAGREITKWYDRQNSGAGFSTAATLMEHAGTGGALFRNLYRDFLEEAYQVTHHQNVRQAHLLFTSIARDWAHIIFLFEEIGATGKRDHVLQASELFKIIAEREKEAMTLLAAI